MKNEEQENKWIKPNAKVKALNKEIKRENNVKNHKKT